MYVENNFDKFAHTFELPVSTRFWKSPGPKLGKLRNGNIFWHVCTGLVYI